MSKEKISQNQLLDISKKLRAVEEEETPFSIINDDQVKVIGDPNLTKQKISDYTVKFRLPISLFDGKPEGAQLVGPYYVIETVYENITITPRNDLKIVDSIMKIMPFFKKLNENGDVEDYTDQELLSVFAYAGDEVMLSIYNLVATFLDIDDTLGEYMKPFSVITTLAQIIENHPEVFNEADAFFG